MKNSSVPRSLIVLAAAGVIALSASGGAVAGGLITSKQIKDNTITTQDIKNGTITTADLAPGTAVSGPQGPAGAAGTPGTPGTAGISGYQVVDGPGTSIASGSQGSASVGCPSGKKVVAVTGYFENSYDGIQGIVGDDLVSAFVYANNTSGSVDYLHAEAVCAFVN